MRMVNSASGVRAGLSVSVCAASLERLPCAVCGAAVGVYGTAFSGCSDWWRQPMESVLFPWVAVVSVQRKLQGTLLIVCTLAAAAAERLRHMLCRFASLLLTLCKRFGIDVGWKRTTKACCVYLSARLRFLFHLRFPRLQRQCEASFPAWCPSTCLCPRFQSITTKSRYARR